MIGFTKENQLKVKRDKPKKAQTGTTKKCSECGKEFYVMPSGISKKTCSYQCAGMAQRKRVKLTCTVCQKEFERTLSADKWSGIRGYTNKVCSKKCLSIAKSIRNKGKIKSKLWSLRQADRIFSDFIRSRDNWTCRNCGKMFKEKSGQLHNSHFWGRGKMATRFDEKNCIALCYYCHYWRFEKEKQGEYRDLMIKWLGIDGYQDLEFKSKVLVKKTEAILLLMDNMADWLKTREDVKKRVAFINGETKTNNAFLVSNEDIAKS